MYSDFLKAAAIRVILVDTVWTFTAADKAAESASQIGQDTAKTSAHHSSIDSRQNPC